MRSPPGNTDNVEPVAAGTDQQLRRQHRALSHRQTEIGAQRLRVRTDDRNFLDRNRAEGGAPHCIDLDWLATIDAARGQTVQRAHRIPDTRLGERNCAPRGGADLRLALPVNQSIKPEIKCDQWNAGQKGADDDRKNIPARKSAH